ncbi:hypothetical protein, partial [Herbaspirillum sp. RV1423]|uniref:hypothetical protein n=1 Tax=Herbaspirillum sp. RV1423 TaxID=1443993 RepID=UPI001E4D67ED
RSIIPGENGNQQVADLKGNITVSTAVTRMNTGGDYRRRVHGNQRNPFIPQQVLLLTYFSL